MAASGGERGEYSSKNNINKLVDIAKILVQRMMFSPFGSEVRSRRDTIASGFPIKTNRYNATSATRIE